MMIDVTCNKCGVHNQITDNQTISDEDLRCACGGTYINPRLFSKRAANGVINNDIITTALAGKRITYIGIRQGFVEGTPDERFRTYERTGKYTLTIEYEEDV